MSLDVCKIDTYGLRASARRLNFIRQNKIFYRILGLVGHLFNKFHLSRYHRNFCLFISDRYIKSSIKKRVRSSSH